MNISKIAIEKIKEFEGCRLQAYQDAAGVWTIGYGHTYNVRQGDRISQWYADDMLGDRISQWYADDMLREDLENVERQLTELHDPEVLHMTQQQLDAVVSFVFNLGIKRWQYSTLRRLIMYGKPKELIQKEWMRWVFAGGKRLPGLVKRRQWECSRFFE